MDNGSTMADILNDLQCQKLVCSRPQVDSRKVQPGDLFVAMPGAQGHGAQFIDQAIANGAQAILTDWHDLAEVSVPIYRSSSIYEDFHRVCQFFYGRPDDFATCIAVTGTNGKTSVTYFLETLCRMKKQKTAVLGTINYRIGDLVLQSEQQTTPSAIDLYDLFATMKRDNVEVLLCEASSHGLAQGRLDSGWFDVAIFTNLTHDHLDYHGSLDEYLKAKKTLFDGLLATSLAVINGESDYADRMVADCAASVVRYGFSPSMDVRCLSWDAHQMVVQFDAGTPVELCHHLVGQHNIENALAVLAVAHAWGCDAKDMQVFLDQPLVVPGRLELYNVRERRVYIDYAHTPDALERVLKTLRNECAVEQKLWVVFGCGGNRDRAKRPVMGAVAASLADCVVITSDNPRFEDPQTIMDDILQGCSSVDRVECIAVRAEAIVWAIEHASKGDVILIAGKGHESYQEIQGQRLDYSDQAVVLTYI